jgi:hypothetical protein
MVHQHELGVFLFAECRTYWFIKLVLPTPLSPRMITCTDLVSVGELRLDTANQPIHPYLEKDLLPRRHVGGLWSIDAGGEGVVVVQ